MQPKYGMFCEAAVSGHVQEQVHIPRGEAEPRSISTDRRLLPMAVARVVALCGVRIRRNK